MNIIKQTHSQNGNEIKLIEVSESSKYDKTVLIIGVTHGDEPQGKFLIDNYIRKLKEDYVFPRTNLKNRLVFIPCLNPDGLELKTRANSNEIDINRNFPTKNWVREPFASEYFGGEAPFSEIETKFVVEILEELHPDIILTLHAPYKVVNYDGPAEEIAKRISEIINYPVQGDIGYPTPGSLGNYAGIERNIPIITLELDEEADVKDFIDPINKIFDYLANY